MKSIFFTLFLFVSPLVFIAQSSPTNTKGEPTLGFIFGPNYSTLNFEGTEPFEAHKTKGLSFNLGVQANFPITRSFLISPKMELASNSNSFIFSEVNGVNPQYIVHPHSINFMTHFLFRASNKEWQPYFLIGPNVKVPLKTKDDGIYSFSNVVDIAIDVGFGLNKVLKNLHFAPEIRYSIGLMDLNTRKDLTVMHLHNLSLMFNLSGEMPKFKQ